MKVEAELELLPIFRQGIEVLLRSNPLLYSTVTRPIPFCADTEADLLSHFF